MNTKSSGNHTYLPNTLGCGIYIVILHVYASESNHKSSFRKIQESHQRLKIVFVFLNSQR